jgi:monoterpene epsilon-lactone hydrolase
MLTNHSGGGFVTNTTSSHRKMVGHLAKAAKCKAFSVEYRLAPEAQFPAQLDDAVEAYRWLLKQGYKSSNIATAGDSAGGNLATATVLKLRELGEPLPAAIIGFSPWYDLDGSEGTIITNNDTDALVHAETLGMMRTMFLGDHDPKDPLANVLLADPKGLPPMYLAAGGFETLLDSSTKFAEKAKKAGVEVELEIAEGMQHVFPFMAGNDERADRTISNAGNWVQGKFEK